MIRRSVASAPRPPPPPPVAKNGSHSNVQSVKKNNNNYEGAPLRSSPSKKRRRLKLRLLDFLPRWRPYDAVSVRKWIVAVTSLISLPLLLLIILRQLSVDWSVVPLGWKAAGRAQPLPPPDMTHVIDMRVLNAELPFDNVDGGVWKQGWDLQPSNPAALKNGGITILVVPHSHCDPGWLKTFDDYFQEQVKSILTTVVDSLLKDARRTFIWAEISYFAWWWDDQNDETKTNVKKLLQAKQLEFVTGGWVQPDEANSELYAMEMQLLEGHDWIREHLGDEFIPQYGWSIDPFGYSPTMAYLLKKYNFRGMLIQRVHYAVKKELAKHQQLEFYWRQTWDTHGDHDIFTHVMPFYSYDVPHTCGPDPNICCQFDFHRFPLGTGPECTWYDAPTEITGDNVKEKALLLLDQYLKKATLYRGDTVLVPLGDDFRYETVEEAEAQYTNHQLIHDYINKRIHGVSIKFGTLSEYFDRVIGQFPPPVLKGSFFTYSDVDEDYWSGYFTSRVFDKALDRQLERVLYAADTVGGTKLELREPRRQLSLFQHHDGVTGTAKDNVVEDYARRMDEAIRFTQRFLLTKLKTMYPQEVSVAGDVQPCLKSIVPRSLSENLCGSQGTVLAYNPSEEQQMCGDVAVPGRQARVADLPCENPGPAVNSKTIFVFDPTTGLMLEPIREEWNVWKVDSGGAYLFRPGKVVSYNMIDDNLDVTLGGFVVETSHWKRTVVERRLPNGLEDSGATVLDFIYEFDLDQDNEEWFVRFHGNIANQGIFHTDLNGFNFDTHRFRPDMPIQSQVFPMPTQASIEDTHKRMTVLSEHAQGTASLSEGTIDVWLDRRLAQDDGRGLEQGVEDTRRTRTRLRLVLENGYYPSENEFEISPVARRMWNELQHPLELFGRHKNPLSFADPDNLLAAEERRERIRERRRKQLMLESTESVSMFSTLTSGVYKALAWTTPLNAVQHGLERVRRAFRRLASTPTVDNTNIPFVYMVYKRVEYLRKAVESLRQSDFPKSRVPLIISHDGRVSEVVEYVESLKSEFQVIQLFHPHSCYEHPNTFPGNDTSLNEKFQGDNFGHQREPWVTCCKHHFTWMLRAVFEDPRFSSTHIFFFVEEDYVVGPTIYSAMVDGLNVMNRYSDQTNGGFFGLVFDPTFGGSQYEPTWLDGDTWLVDSFRSGPMTMNRDMYRQWKDHAVAYCRFDDYNWDWSFVHLQGLGHLPHTILVPSRCLVRHIGAKAGMHNHQDRWDFGPSYETLDTKFRGTNLLGNVAFLNRTLFHRTGYGGWSHPADQQHCIDLLTANK